MLCISKELGKRRTCARRYDIEGLFRAVFDPRVSDIGRHIEPVRHLAQEKAFLRGRLEKTDSHAVGQHDRQNKARKAGARAEIGKGSRADGYMGGELRAVPDMAPPHVLK